MARAERAQRMNSRRRQTWQFFITERGSKCNAVHTRRRSQRKWMGKSWVEWASRRMAAGKLTSDNRSDSADTSWAVLSNCSTLSHLCRRQRMHTRCSQWLGVLSRCAVVVRGTRFCRLVFRCSLSSFYPLTLFAICLSYNTQICLFIKL